MGRFSTGNRENMTPIPEHWTAGLPVITDGAWGTELQKRGLEPGACPDEWNLTFPERVAEVARSYVDAGSRVVLTNTFRASPIALAAAGLIPQMRGINRAGVRISREEAGSKALVFASLGPSGKLLAADELTEDEAYASFAAQAEALAEEHPDALLLETFADLAESSIALRAARATGLPVIVSFVFDSGRNKDRTMMGATPEQAAARMESEGASAVGANCGVGIEAAASVCRRLRAATGLPVWMKPNAGLPEIKAGGTLSWPDDSESFCRGAEALANAGATFIGGCCGTGPPVIRALRSFIDKRRSSS